MPADEDEEENTYEFHDYHAEFQKPKRTKDPRPKKTSIPASKDPGMYRVDSEVQVVESIKQVLFESIDEIVDEVCHRLNKGKQLPEFEATKGEKYVSVKCTVCKKFCVWFHQQPIGGLKFFRVINLNHLKSKHCQ